MSGPGLQKSSQFRLSSSLVLVNLDLDEKTNSNELGDLVLTICCGMHWELGGAESSIA